MATIVTGDGVELHYTDDGDGPPVVLPAGFCAPAESWEIVNDDTWAHGFYGLTRQNSVIEDAGHAVDIDRPDTTDEAILEFLK